MGLPRFWRNLCCSHPQFLTCGHPFLGPMFGLTSSRLGLLLHVLRQEPEEKALETVRNFVGTCDYHGKTLAKPCQAALVPGSLSTFALLPHFAQAQIHRRCKPCSPAVLRNKHWHTLILKCPLEKDMFMLPRGCCNMMMYIQYRQTLAVSICKMHLLHYIIMVSNI